MFMLYYIVCIVKCGESMISKEEEAAVVGKKWKAG